MKGYTQAVLWVAQEDDPEITDLDEIRGMVTCQLLASIYDKSAIKVAEDIRAFRTKSIRVRQAIALRKIGIDPTCFTGI